MRARPVIWPYVYTHANPNANANADVNADANQYPHSDAIPHTPTHPIIIAVRQRSL